MTEITLEQIDHALRTVALLMQAQGEHGLAYLPIFERLEREREQMSSLDNRLAMAIARSSRQSAGPPAGEHPMATAPILFRDYPAFEEMLETSHYIEAQSRFFRDALRAHRALDRDILNWTKPTTGKISQLLNWLQGHLNELHGNARPESDNYRLFARGLAMDILFNLKGLHPDPPRSTSSNPWGIVRDEDAYWRCVAICSAAWTVAPEA
ncbi:MULTISPECIES: hypothetical protein [unclassified Mesorhizobium]|uniref:hypothetical protein n=1 Tax=unclassified Mesorhizobium TaxID=325217 RepID=UPI00112CDB01|nr:MULTISPECIES: hypothetical protein [unclassified Mesorhizobium]TPK53809.1 hypothetical protein FJ550_09435 [Mesorhizobium sp. B2-5-2]TPL17182.1 hypothetical protein FJ946_28845 [Mesorhizobium sp. B2-4-7]TPL33407.1 hypothetical protein FJ961_28835 [Mesorhizobium sp. B2-4-5]TPM69153.1 hypothetical protein FJ968_28430 [Mesorhizobium sp. B2-1-6]TPN73638.1 hypothetical protein FJ985_25785 [Mesorhizobium sp. B1-1-2]